MGICQLLRVLRSRKVVWYKVEISIPNPWILQEGEVLANEGCWVNQVHGWDLKCFRVGKSCQLGKRMRCDIIKTKYWYID